MILYYKSHGMNASEAGRVFNIDRRLVKDWVEMEDEIEQATHKRIKCTVAHKEVTGEYHLMEVELYDYVTKLRNENKLVNASMIRTQALALFEHIYDLNPQEGKIQSILKHS